MRVITVASTKGGVGKTTLASALAVKAASESERVAMVDLDPQGSLAAWWARRGRSKNPEIFTGADTASEAVEKLALAGWDYVFIDTPPAFVATIEDAVTSADLTIVPLRASALDLIGSEDAVFIAREAQREHLAVINDAEPRWKTTEAAREYLLTARVPVACTIIAHRQAYLAAMTRGLTGPEIDKRDRKAADEIDQLWLEIKSLLANRPARSLEQEVA